MVRRRGGSPPVFSIRTPVFQKNEDGSGKRTSFALSLHSQARATLKRREEMFPLNGWWCLRFNTKNQASFAFHPLLRLQCALRRFTFFPSRPAVVAIGGDRLGRALRFAAAAITALTAVDL